MMFVALILFVMQNAKTIIVNRCRIAEPSQKESLGIIVQYKVKVKLFISGPLMGGYVFFLQIFRKPTSQTK